MHNINCFVLIAIIFFGLMKPAYADDFSMLEDQPATGTLIRRKVILGSLLPIRKRYNELSDSEREIVRGRYNDMLATDEPPYPKYGLISIYKLISAAHGKLLVSGKVEMYVTIDGSGKPQKVDIYRSPDSEVSRVFANVLLLTDFKPAICNGQPCTMEFPLIVDLTVTN